MAFVGQQKLNASNVADIFLVKFFICISFVSVQQEILPQFAACKCLKAVVFLWEDLLRSAYILSQRRTGQQRSYSHYTFLLL